MPEVVAEARQGLAIGGPAEVGFDKGTLPYVPGSTVRGALATAWIKQNGMPDSSNPLREEFVRARHLLRATVSGRNGRHPAIGRVVQVPDHA